MDMSAPSSPTYASRCACCISGTGVSPANCTVSNGVALDLIVCCLRCPPCFRIRIVVTPSNVSPRSVSECDHNDYSHRITSLRFGDCTIAPRRYSTTVNVQYSATVRSHAVFHWHRVTVDVVILGESSRIALRR